MPAFPASLSEFLQAIFMPRRSDLQFAVKSVFAGILALYLAFRFELQQPQWALVTVFVVSQPLSGMVLAKSVFRLFGTLAGAIASVTLIALFGQAPLPFLLCMAAWLAFCTAGASLLQNFASYGFVLAGYTAAIIALPSTAAPMAVFDQAVARCSEIGLGILCASLVSLLLWPRRVQLQLAEQGRAAWLAGMQAAAAELSGADERGPLLRGIGRMVAVDAQREQAWFEGESGRRSIQALHVLNADLLGLLRSARKVAREWRLLDAAAAAELEPRRAEVMALLEKAESRAFAECRERLEADAAQAEVQPRLCLAALAHTLALASEAQRSMESLIYGEAPRVATGVIVGHRDFERALLLGLRSALAFLCVALFWVVSAWPSGLGAVSITGVLLSLFATRDDPSGAALNFLRGILLSIPLAFVGGLIVLPLCDGFPALATVLGVPLFIAALCMTRPRLAAIASSFCIFYVNNIGPRNDMHYDLGHFLNSALATVLGVGFAVLVFNLLHLQPGERHYRRLLAAILGDLARLARGPLPLVEGWFEGRSADRLLRLARFYKDLPSEHRARWRVGLAGLDLGDELLQLRQCLVEARGPLRRARDTYLQQLGEALLAGGPREDRELLLDAASQVLLQALEADRRLAGENREMARAAVLQLQSVWRRWCRQIPARTVLPLAPAPMAID